MLMRAQYQSVQFDGCVQRFLMRTEQRSSVLMLHTWDDGERYEDEGLKVLFGMYGMGIDNGLYSMGIDNGMS
jgi:hypothetical protein